MTFYRDRADGPIHAVEFTVIDQGEAIASVKAIHLKGVPQSQLRSHIKNVLGVLNAQFGRQQLPVEQQLPLGNGQQPDDSIPALTVSKAQQPIKLCPLCLKQEDDAHD